jgi:hypothetical protein
MMVFMARNSDPVVGVFRSDGGVDPGPDNSDHEYRCQGAEACLPLHEVIVTQFRGQL